MDLYLKSDGKYVKKELTQDEFLGWFKSNIDDEGNVKEDCLLYKDADLKVNTDKSITMIMSDDSLDRDFERFDTAGWDLRKYKKNNVLLWSHDRSIPAIGKMEKVRVKDNRLIGNPVFDPDDELAVKIGMKVQKGIIKAGSVGFFPSKIEFNDDEKDPCKLTYLKQELREFSMCNVPANPMATVIEEPGKSTHMTQTDPVKREALNTLPGYHEHTQVEPTENDDCRIDTAVITVVDWQDFKTRLETMEEDVRIVQEMQMKMSQTVAKDNVNYYEAMLKGQKKPPSRDLKSLLKQRRTS